MKENQLKRTEREIFVCAECGAEWKMQKGEAQYCPGCANRYMAPPCNYTFDEANGIHMSIRSLRERINALEQVTEALTFRFEKMA